MNYFWHKKNDMVFTDIFIDSQYFITMAFCDTNVQFLWGVLES